MIEKFEESLRYELGKYGYGKTNIKLFHVHRKKDCHHIREVEVDIRLRLSTNKDYLEGDNRDIIATDSQKNTVYILAKKYGIKTPEDFGLLICEHFLRTYKHITEVNVRVEEYPWERHRSEGQPHNHAFVYSPSAIRSAVVTHRRNDSVHVQGSLKNLRVLKSTQSAFKDFIQDEYRTLEDVNDRIFSTIVTSTWDYSTTDGVNFDKTFDEIKQSILDKFAGPVDKGIFSPSVQNTLYLAAKFALDRIPQISRIEIHMPNKHYFPVDMTKFSSIVGTNQNDEVYLPVDKPSGIIYAEVYRKQINSKL